jgi:choline kinase
MKYNIILMSYEITKGMKSKGSKGLSVLTKNKTQDFLINHQITTLNNLCSFTNNHFSIVLGFDKDKIKKKIDLQTIKVIDNDKYDTLGQAYALLLAMENIDRTQNTIVATSNMLLDINENALKNYNELENSSIITTTKENNDLNIGVTTGADNSIEYMFFDLPSMFWTEVFILHHKNYQLFKDLCSKNKHKSLFEIINLSLKYTNIKQINISKTKTKK